MIIKLTTTTSNSFREKRSARLVLFGMLVVFFAGCGSDTAEPDSVDVTPPDPPPADTTAPSVSISSPTPGGSVTSPVTVSVSASDASGIESVSFFSGGNLIDELSSPPYEIVWSPAVGTQTLRVEATDASTAANTAEVEASYDVVPDPPAPDTTAPSLAIISPTPGGTVSSPVMVSVSASDASGIESVSFFSDGNLIGELNSPPYEIVWSPATGSRTLRVEATDVSAAANTAVVEASYDVVPANSTIPPAGQWQESDFATVYNVGPGMQFSEVSDVPWESVGPDTLVRIHWRAEPYRAKWVLNAIGTQSSPIVVSGVPNGTELPVISGEDAVTRTELSFTNQERSILKVGGASTPSGSLAEWIFIENLDIRGANPSNQFQTDSGQSQSYASNAASIHVQLGRNVYIRNNILQDSGNGLFSGFQSESLVISGNRFVGNGNVGSSSQHNSYTESLGIIYEFNYFRPLRSGALGNNLKDRSAGTVIRYNWIESGSRELDLVDSDHSNIYDDPSYGETFVYGNVLIEPANSSNGNVVHYGGDLSGREATYRKGVLHFYNNTIVSYRNDRVVLFGMSSNDEAADARNNLFYSPEGGDTLAITSGRGLIDLSGNWLQSGWDVSSEALTGTVNDLGNTEATDPVFADEGAMNFRLTGTSSAANAGVDLAAAANSHPLNFEYQEHQSRSSRVMAGSVDAGAFEFAGQVSVPQPEISTASLADGQTGSAYSEFLIANEGTLPFTWAVSAGVLPAGLSLDTSTGEIAGTPSTDQTQAFTVVVTDANQQSDSAALSITITEPPMGGSVLDGYSVASGSQNLNFISSDLSGIAYVPDTNTFFLIQNNGGGLWEVDINFNRLRTLSLNGFGDTEDIVYLGNNEFAIVNESSQLFIGTIAASTTQISAGSFQRVQFDTYSGNAGYEGVAYDLSTETFYVVKEASPKRIRSFPRPAGSADIIVTATTPFDANQLPVGDLSSVLFDTRTGRLLILSHESHRLLDVGLDGFVHGQLPMADSTQHEGVAMDSSFNIYVTSEPRSYRVYSQ